MRGSLGSPFLTHLELREERVQRGLHPFEIPLLQHSMAIEFTTPVTFLVGENGSGKSTLLEALAWSVGFGAQGGNRDHRGADDADDAEGSVLGRALRVGWRQRTTEGFFMRAETFFNFATTLESLDSNFARYGGESLHAKSHGEAFLSLFEHRFDDGLFLLDEPEAALSPQRQLAFLQILHRLTVTREAQFVIATHSPMLLAFPGATVLSLDGGVIEPIDYRDTDHFRITRDFLAAPERFFRYLFEE
ncbi:AAA family ATPase [Gemmatimonas sp.]|uniref:AAA family ATPase n=1 Tax=Gemmatimonas sp. TaxID=1962908 RepID=UPI00398326CD